MNIALQDLSRDSSTDINPGGTEAAPGQGRTAQQPAPGLLAEDTPEQRLAALEARVRADLDLLSYATRPWVIPRQYRGQTMLDVVILGGGQSGLVLAHSLKRRGVTNIVILDRNPEGYEGVWETFARNYELRSPKTITGSDLGIPSLSVQSWFVARHGQEAWDAILRVPRKDWMDYLRWYRRVADLPVRNGVEVTGIDYDAEGVTLTSAKGEQIRSRYVVLATGMEGGGQWAVPDHIRTALPPSMYSHACQIYDTNAARGRDIGVLGAGAGAFDNSVAALDAGARRVDTFMRRPTVGLMDLVRECEYAGYLQHSHELADATKWELSNYMSGLSQAPAEHHFNKALSFPNFRFWPGADWQHIRHEDGKAVVTTPKGEFRFDYVIAATGSAMNMASRPELARIAEEALLWGDRFVPPKGDEGSRKLKLPYLDRDFRFQPRDRGASAGIDRVFAINGLAMMSMGGLACVSISSHRYGIPRAATGITRQLFLDQEDLLVPGIRDFDTPCIDLSPYARAMLGLDDQAAQ